MNPKKDNLSGCPFAFRSGQARIQNVFTKGGEAFWSEHYLKKADDLFFFLLL